MPRGGIQEQQPTVAEQVKESAKRPAAPKNKKITRDRLVPSGSTLLNLACTETVDGAYVLGEYVNIVGDKSTGKTSGTLEVFAACAQLSRFDDYEFIFDEPERSNLFNMEAQFGKKAAARIRPPARDKDGVPVYSRTVEDFEVNVRRALKCGSPVIYVLDSFDALSSEMEMKKSDQRVAAKEKKDKKSREEKAEEGAAEEKEKKLAGSYGMEKAKGASQLFRLITADLQNTRSLLVVISQVRDNSDPMSMKKDRRAGGRAHDFYANHVIWLSCVEKIRDAKHKRQLGDWVKASVDKNKTTGKKRYVEYPSYVGYGIDDTDSMLDFLLVEGIINKSGAYVTWKGENWLRKELIKHLESDRVLLAELKQMTADAWMQIEDAIKIDRVPKYR